MTYWPTSVNELADGLEDLRPERLRDYEGVEYLSIPVGFNAAVEVMHDNEVILVSGITWAPDHGINASEDLYYGESVADAVKAAREAVENEGGRA